jgi:hypothetical protein
MDPVDAGPLAAGGHALAKKRRTGAFSLLMESEARLYDFELTRFLHANRYPLRSKTL